MPTLGLPVPDPDFEDPKEVYAFYGLAAYTAQVLEQGLLNWVVALMIAGERRVTPATVERLLETFEEQTFGQLLRIVRERVTVPAEVDSVLDHALRRRNYLVHRFFAVHSEDFISGAGRRSMIGELRDAVRLFEEADKASESVYLPLVARLGVTQEVISQQMDLLLQRAEARDAAT